MEINQAYTPYIRNSLPTIDTQTAKKLDEKKLVQAAQGLEAEFLKVFLKESKKIAKIQDKSEIKAPGKDVMTDYMFERLAEHMAKTSPLGISDMIVKNIQESQELNSDTVEE